MQLNDIEKTDEPFDNWDLVHERFSFKPKCENLTDILEHTKPTGKCVLSVAAYGYPLVFLAEGAKRLVSFDVDYKSILWNRFLRDLIKQQNYQQHIDSLFTPIESPDNNLIKKKFGECIQQSNPFYKDRLIDLLVQFYEDLNRMKEIPTFYPHVKDAQTYAHVKQAIERGQWIITQRELKELLKYPTEDDSIKYDVIYTSSIRNWVLHHRFAGNVKEFEEEYDKELGALVSQSLNPAGVFYEALITTENRYPRSFPRNKITPDLYTGLSVCTHKSVIAEHNTELVVGTKEK